MSEVAVSEVAVSELAVHLRRSSRVRRRVAATVVFLVSLASCSADDGSPDATRTGSPGASPTTSTSASASATASSSGTATAGVSGGTAAPGSGGGVAPVAPARTVTPAPGTGAPAAPAAAARVGTYPATQNGAESFGPTGGTQTSREYPERIDITISGSGDTRVFRLPYSPDREDELTLRFTGGRIELVSAKATVRFGEFAQERVLAPQPALVLLPANARVGQTFNGTFSGESSGRYDGRVLRRDRQTIGGTAVDTLVVEVATTLTGGDIVGTLRTVTHWDTSRGLPVSQLSESELRDSLNTYRQRVQGTLSRLTPA